MRPEPIETLEHRGLTIKIYPDGDVESPRDWDNAGTMVCWHSRYNLGDKHSHAAPNNMLADLVRECPLDEQSIRELVGDLVQDRDHYRQTFQGMNARRSGWKDYLADVLDEGNTDPDLDNKVLERLEKNGLVILPLHLYDHSGITMSTSRFSCPWDSGQVGYIYATPDRVSREWGDGPDARDKAKACLEAEVKVYDQFLRGDVYGYQIENDSGEVLDSCWGYYGQDECESESKGAADAILDADAAA